MERIASFCVDHTKLDRGMYLSRQDGDVLTWDIRMKKPNQGDYLSTAAAHTLEHLFATYARNSAFQDGVIYVGPMGCRTGFYLLTRGLTPAQALELTVESFRFMAAFEGAVCQRSGVRQLPRHGSACRQGRGRCHAAGSGSPDRRPSALLSLCAGTLDKQQNPELPVGQEVPGFWFCSVYSSGSPRSGMVRSSRTSMARSWY